MESTIINSVSEQAVAIRDRLMEWASPLGGTAAVVSNLKDLWSQVYQSSNKPTVYVCYMGEKARGPFSLANALSRVDRSWSVLIKRGRGFYSVRGDSLSANKQEIPFYDCVEQVREQLRSMINISAEGPMIDFKGIRPASQGTQVIDAYVIEFSTANDIPRQYTQPTTI